MSSESHFLFQLNDEFALGGDSQTLLLLKLRDSLWNPVLRCGNGLHSVIKVLKIMDIQLHPGVADELKSLPEIFWEIPLATSVSVTQEY